ncbi:MAG: hypothetical protein ACOZB0_05815 [Pseudomonadota bacterium]
MATETNKGETGNSERLEQLGVRVSNPDLMIGIDGQSFADLVLYHYLHAENLRRCLAVLAQESTLDTSEPLSELQAQLQALANGSSGVLSEHLRIAREQGLRFEITGDRTRH